MLLETGACSFRHYKGQTKRIQQVDQLLQISGASTEIVLPSICTLQAQLWHPS